MQVKLEDAGFDWKILGPDVQDLDYVAWQCDQDAYACSGQKCSAQSILFMHSNWVDAGVALRCWQGECPSHGAPCEVQTLLVRTGCLCCAE